MTDVLPKVIALLLNVPAVLILLALLGFLIQLKWVWVGNLVIASALAALFGLSLPLTGKNLLANIEGRVKPLPPSFMEKPGKLPGAIVVLGGGRYASAPEYGGDTVDRFTLERLRYAAHLQRETRLPILVSGGAPYGDETPEAALMKAVLERDFGAKVEWVEDTSDNTMENARHTRAMLTQVGIRHVFLATHAWHMPRARWAFVQIGLEVTEAPTAFTTLGAIDRKLLGYIPSGRGLHLSSIAISERLGLMWYEYKYRVETLAPASEKKAAPAAG